MGHEQYAIEGAITVIKRIKPLLIVEIEQRLIKKDINEIFKKIIGLNYSGFFLQIGALISIDVLDFKVHQRPYLIGFGNVKDVNNFILLQNSNA